MITFLAFFSLLSAVLPDRTFSEAENRMLQKKPCFALDDILAGKFSLAAEKYLADQFAFRDLWVGVKSVAELALQKKDNNGVYFGRDGYLLQKPEKPDRELLAQNIAAINEFAGNVRARVYFLPAPVSVQILSDKLPSFAAPRQTLEQLDLLREQLAPEIHFIDARAVLTLHRQEEIYYKTDHHWTSLGAYYAYREAAGVMDFEPLGPDDYSQEQVCDNFYGTLYSKSSHPFVRPDAIRIFKPKEEFSCRVEYVHEKRTADGLYAAEHLQKKDKYAFFLDGNHPLLRIKVQNHTDRRLLVVKDSYANAFIPFLVNHFAEIHIIDLRYFNAPLTSYLEQYGFNEVLILYSSLSFAEDPALRKMGQVF